MIHPLLANRYNAFYDQIAKHIHIYELNFSLFIFNT